MFGTPCYIKSTALQQPPHSSMNEKKYSSKRMCNNNVNCYLTVSITPLNNLLFKKIPWHVCWHNVKGEFCCLIFSNWIFLKWIIHWIKDFFRARRETMKVCRKLSLLWHVNSNLRGENIVINYLEDYLQLKAPSR